MVALAANWKYVNLRRYFIYLERCIDRGTQWAVFELQAGGGVLRRGRAADEDDPQRHRRRTARLHDRRRRATRRRVRGFLIGRRTADLRYRRREIGDASTRWARQRRGGSRDQIERDPEPLRATQTALERSRQRIPGIRQVQTSAAPAARPRRCILWRVLSAPAASSHAGWHPVAGDRVSSQELRHRLSDGLGALDLQEMADPVDCALLDVRERGAEELGDLHP